MKQPTTINFGPADGFSADLLKQIKEYTSKHAIHGDMRLYTKTAVFLIGLVVCYGFSITRTVPLLCRLLASTGTALSFGGIGMCIMHDAGHGAYSNKKWINTLMGYTLNLLGFDIVVWKTKHNILHHTDTNIDHHDDDIDLYPLIRLHENQKKLWFHKYQHWYCWILYCFLTLQWFAILDPKRYLEGKIFDKKINFRKRDYWIFGFTKIWHILVFLVIPYYLVGASALANYAIIMGLSGLVLACVFQCAHVLDIVPIKLETDNFKHTCRYRHQLETTANFAQRNTLSDKILNWFIGGLNHQVEHHLFYNISHVHYPAIAKIVRETCKKWKVEYKSLPSFRDALASHYRKIRSLAIM